MSNQANIKTGSQDIMENNSNFDFSVIVCCYNPDLEKLNLKGPKLTDFLK